MKLAPNEGTLVGDNLYHPEKWVKQLDGCVAGYADIQSAKDLALHHQNIRGYPI